MGRPGSRPRKPPRRLPPAGSHLGEFNDPIMTPAAEVRAFGRIAHACAYGTRRQQRAVTGLFLTWLLLPIVFALVGGLIYVLVQHL